MYALYVMQTESNYLRLKKKLLIFVVLLFSVIGEIVRGTVEEISLHKKFYIE